MKKIVIFIVSLMCVFSFSESAQADTTMTVLCSYESLSGNGTFAQIYLKSDMIHILYSTDKWTDVKNHFSNVLSNITDPTRYFHPISSTYRRVSEIGKTIAAAVSSSDDKYQDFYITGPGLNMIYRSNQDMNTEDDGGTVTWYGYNYTNLIDYGECPAHVLIMHNPFGLGVAGTSYYEDGHDLTYVLDSWDPKNHFVMKSGSETSATLFTNDLSSEMAKASSSCVTDEDGLNAVKENVTYLSTLYAVAGSKSTMGRIYKNRGYITLAEDIINKYKPGGTCYQSASNQQLSEEISNKAQELVTLVDSGASYVVDVKTCSDIIGDIDNPQKIAYYINYTFKIIKYAAPILLIVMSIIDYSKAIISSDKDVLNKTNKNTVIRIIFAILIFFIPLFTKILLSLFGISSDCGI